MMTAEQFGQLITADTVDYELVDGELIPLSSGTLRHAKVRRRLERELEDYFYANPGGAVYSEVDCRLTSDTVRRPDVSVFLGADRLGQLDENTIPAPFTPDIAVEVLSPSESAVELRRKVRDYLRAGSIEVWLIDHSNAEVTVYSDAGVRLIDTAGQLQSPLLPGFTARISELIA